MKTKSKLVLGLSILSAATLAAGATSTFAWYVASAGTVSLTGTKAGTVATSASEFAATQITVATSDVNSKLDKLVLSDGSGKTYGWVNGQAIEANVPDGYTTITPVKWTFTAAGDDDAKAAQGVYYVSFEKSENRVRTNDTADTYAQEDCYTSLTITAQGLIEGSANEVTLYISVDGGNAKDDDPVGGTITATLQQNEFSPESTYSVGAVVIHEGALYRCHTAVSSAGEWTNTTNWTAMNLVAAA